MNKVRVLKITSSLSQSATKTSRGSLQIDSSINCLALKQHENESLQSQATPPKAVKYPSKKEMQYLIHSTGGEIGYKKGNDSLHSLQFHS